MDIRIFPPEEMIESTVSLPLSKSISNRALIMNALSLSNDTLDNVAHCDDTEVMIAALSAPLSSPQSINIGMAGTAMRFLTAYFAAIPGADVVIDGSERMRQRPIGELVEALQQCGADIQYAGEPGFPPLHIKGKTLHGGRLEIDASISSQFLSALLMVSPTFSSELDLTLVGNVASEPYLRMTIEMMRQHGISIDRERNNIKVSPSQYLFSRDFKIERDWSAASYWYEIAAMSAGWITLDGLTKPSLQGDSALADIFVKLGIITQFEDGNAVLNPSPEMFSRLELDLSDTPDIAQTLAVTCCMLGVPFRFSGLQSLRIKETDRIAALVDELAKLSYRIDIEKDGVIVWENGRIPVREVGPISTYGDHRMAMAFAPIALFLPGIIIKDAEVVSKSYPEFWNDLQSAGFIIEEV